MYSACAITTTSFIVLVIGCVDQNYCDKAEGP